MNSTKGRFWAHPLFWWLLQQTNGVWMAYDAISAFCDSKWLALVSSVVALFVTTRWRVPPFAVAVRGKWRPDEREKQAKE